MGSVNDGGGFDCKHRLAVNHLQLAVTTEKGCPFGILQLHDEFQIRQWVGELDFEPPALGFDDEFPGLDRNDLPPDIDHSAGEFVRVLNYLFEGDHGLCIVVVADCDDLSGPGLRWLNDAHGAGHHAQLFFVADDGGDFFPALAGIFRHVAAFSFLHEIKADNALKKNVIAGEMPGILVFRRWTRWN